MKVCLFDIDGTLLHSGGAGGSAMLAAIREEFGASGPLYDIPAAGRTDRAIAIDVFNAYDLPFSELSFRQFLDCYLKLLPTHLKDCEPQGRVYPGMPETLEILSQRDDIVLGLLTGNYREAAYLKLEHYGMHHHFDFGGFGDKYTSRNDVAKEALGHVHQRLGSDFDSSDVWVIGDTPADVECARAIGSNVVAVATGIYSIEELKPTEPDYLFEDFSDLDRFLKLLEF
jgi:phosphoglycolate phosphatase